MRRQATVGILALALLGLVALAPRRLGRGADPGLRPAALEHPGGRAPRPADRLRGEEQQETAGRRRARLALRLRERPLSHRARAAWPGRQPPRRPELHASEFGNRTCPVDSQVGVVEAGVDRQSSARLPIPRPRYNMVPREGEAGLLAFEVFGIPDLRELRVEDQQRLRPRDQDRRPRRARRSHYRGPDPLGGAGGPRPRPPAAPLGGIMALVRRTLRRKQRERHAEQGRTDRAADRPELGLDLLQANSPTSSTIRLTALPNPSSRRRRPAAKRRRAARRSRLRRHGNHADGPLPRSNRLRSAPLQPKPRGTPTTDATDSPSGLDVDLSPPVREPDGPLALGDPRHRRYLPEASRSTPTPPTARPPAQTTKRASGPQTKPTARRPRRSAPSTSTLRYCQAPCRATSTWATPSRQPLPRLPHRRRLQRPRQAGGKGGARPATGQIGVIFEDLPETPFQKFSLHIFGSERGALATPTKCGTYAVTTTFTPWDAVFGNQSSTTFFTSTRVPTAHPARSHPPLHPRLRSGLGRKHRRRPQPLRPRPDPPDGDQYLSALNVKTPPGFSATLKGVPYCPEAAIAAASRGAYSGISEQATRAARRRAR